MIARHSFNLVCKCPTSGLMDSYCAVVEVHDRVLLCEDIEAVALEFLGRVAYQEELTKDLAERLNARVSMTGRHGMIETETSAELCSISAE